MYPILMDENVLTLLLIYSTLVNFKGRSTGWVGGGVSTPLVPSLPTFRKRFNRSIKRPSLTWT